jgi:hypothetical protein
MGVKGRGNAAVTKTRGTAPLTPITNTRPSAAAHPLQLIRFTSSAPSALVTPPLHSLYLLYWYKYKY